MTPLHEAGLVVAARTEEATGVVSLTLRHPEAQPLPAWEPGAHVDLVLTDGLVRPYSLCGDPADRTA
ncbi:oxidoreductase, partial [Streptomyces sp. A475]